MLQFLKVFNFALIEQAEIEFSAGFNVLTGETGAGKSIVVDALSVVLGGRSSVDMIRSGSEQFRVEAVFEPQQTRNCWVYLNNRRFRWKKTAGCLSAVPFPVSRRIRC